MPQLRSVVVTGASRGLGLASAAYLYKSGWRVVGAMRSPDAGLVRLRDATGAEADDPRLVAVPLDLDDSQSIIAAAKKIEDSVGAPDAVVHNAGISAVGSVEDMPFEIWERLFRTNLFGPVQLTRALLPSMRIAGHGRIVVVSSAGAVRGMPTISAYSASKGALERWAEALAEEMAPFGLGVSILVAGTFKTDILTEMTPDYGDHKGPYAGHYASIRHAGSAMVDKANPPELFAKALAKALEDRSPFAKYPVGSDARMLLIGSRLMSVGALHTMIQKAMGLPRFGALRRIVKNSSRAVRRQS